MTIYSKEQKKIIEKLKTARIEAGLSQEDVSGKLKKTQSYMSKLESGQRRIDVLVLAQLAELYNKSLDYFLS